MYTYIYMYGSFHFAPIGLRPSAHVERRMNLHMERHMAIHMELHMYEAPYGVPLCMKLHIELNMQRAK